MGYSIRPYNLAEQVKKNTKGIYKNKIDIDQIYVVLDSLPDVSGFYTKAEVDSRLSTKIDNTYIATSINQTSNLFFSENGTFTIQKVNNGDESGTNLGVFTSGVSITNTDGTPKYATDLWNPIVKQQFDEQVMLLATKEDLTNLATNQDILDVENQINQNIIDIQDINTNIDSIEDEVFILTEDVQLNTNSIDTLNNLIKQSFNTFGSYISPSGSATDQVVRPILTENIALDSEYVVVSTKPEANNFLNKKAGKIIFTIGLSNLTNLGTDIANLKLNINYNGNVVLAPNVDIPVGWSGSRTITGTLEVDQDSNVYVEYVVVGSLSVDAPIQYNIEFNNTSVVSSPSSSVLNDKTANPNLGINADLNKIDSNTNRITTTETNITNLQTQINNLVANLNNLLPIGSIIISSAQPLYGVWVSLGVLELGQSIIGGASSIGGVIRHSHKWNNFINYKTMDGGGYWVSVGYDTFDINGNVISQNSDDNVNGTNGLSGAWTAITGNDKNYAYGLGIGANMQVWKRTG